MAGAKEIKSFLKENGIETQNIRITSSSSINVKLLDPNLDFDQIEKLLKDKYESYQRDEGSGEILSGGNTFVFIEYDYDVVQSISQELHPTIRPFLEKCSGQWSIQGLVKHYVESQSLSYNIHIVKRSFQEALHLYLKANSSDIDGLTIDGWN